MGDGLPRQSQEFVSVASFLAHTAIDALIIGFYEGRRLHYCATVRGFVPASRRSLYDRTAATTAVGQGAGVARPMG